MFKKILECEFCKISIPIIALIGLGFYLAYQFVPPPPPDEITIATGRAGGGYHSFALRYQSLLQTQSGLTLHLRPTAGSPEALKLLRQGEVDVALVQGGTAGEADKQQLRAIASLFYEPLWLFHRKGLDVEYLFDLKGKTLAVGEPESGTRALALQLLADNNITADNTRFTEHSAQQAIEHLQNGALDAAFFVTSPRSPLILRLLHDENLDLLNFRRHLAYNQKYPFLKGLVIGEGAIDLEQNIPAGDKTLLAATASLVGQKDLHPALVRSLLRVITEVHRPGGFIDPPEAFPAAAASEIPMNEEAARYIQRGPSWLERYLPFQIAIFIDRMKIMLLPLITLMIPLLRSALPIYRWRIRAKIYRWYATLRELDFRIDGLQDPANIDQEMQTIRDLEQELAEQVSVPLAYMGEFYDLRLHIELILKKLEQRKAQLK